MASDIDYKNWKVITDKPGMFKIVFPKKFML